MGSRCHPGSGKKSGEERSGHCSGLAWPGPLGININKCCRSRGQQKGNRNIPNIVINNATMTTCLWSTVAKELELELVVAEVVAMVLAFLSGQQSELA